MESTVNLLGLGTVRAPTTLANFQSPTFVLQHVIGCAWRHEKLKALGILCQKTYI